MAFFQKSAAGLELGMVLVPGPFECYGFVVREYRACLRHAIKRMAAVLCAATADALAAQMSLASLFPQFQNRLHHTDMGFNAGNHDLPLYPCKFGADFLEEAFKSRIPATAETGLVQEFLHSLRPVKRGADVGMSRSQPLRVLLCQHNGDAKKICQLEEPDRRSDYQSGPFDHLHQFSLEVDDEHDAAVYVQEFHSTHPFTR